MNKEIQIKHFELLCVIEEIFNKYNIEYWLDGGTLLTCYRDGNLEYEHDTDIGCKIENYNKVNQTIDDFKSKGVICKPFFPFYHTIFNENTDIYIHCDLIYWYPIFINSEKWRTCHGNLMPFSLPERLIIDFDRYFFKDFDNLLGFPIPKDIEEYLEWYFGDWKIKMLVNEYGQYQKDVKSGNFSPYKINIARPETVGFWADAFNAHYDKYKEYIK